MRIGINAHLLAFSQDYRQAGLSRYIYELVTRIPRDMEREQFVAFAGSTQPSPQFLRDMPPNLTLSPSALPTASAPARILWEQTALPAAAALKRLDLLHCPVNVRPFVSPCPVVVTVHDLAFLRYPEAFKPLKRLYLTAMTGWSCRHCSHVVTVSESTRRDVIKMLRVPVQRVTTVHNGVGEEFRPLPAGEIDAFKHRHGIDGLLVLFVGTLEPRKNIPVLLRAAAALRSDDHLPPITLVIGGSKGWYYDRIFSTASALGLVQSGAVRFLGRVPDDELPLWYNSATVFAYPSLYEGFGLPVLEAMACGTTVLASNTSAFPEIVGHAGTMLDPHDVAAWTRALRSLLLDAAEACRLGAAGIERSKLFSWEKAARETAGIYRQVAAGSTARRPVRAPH